MEENINEEVETRVTNTVNQIKLCVNQLNNDFSSDPTLVSPEVIDNLDGEEINVLLYDDRLKFNARFSKVKPREPQTRRKNSYSFFGRQTGAKCPFTNVDNFVNLFRQKINNLLENFNLNERNKSFSRKARNFFRSKENQEKLRKKFYLLKRRYKKQLDKINVNNIAEERDQNENIHRNMCRSLLYLDDILKNASKIPLRRLSIFLQHLFHEVGTVETNNMTLKEEKLEKVKSILIQLVESYRNQRLIDLAEENEYVQTPPPPIDEQRKHEVSLDNFNNNDTSYEIDVDDLIVSNVSHGPHDASHGQYTNAFGKGRHKSRRSHHSKKTRHGRSKGRNSRKTHRRHKLK
jgi:hypothetical protein